MNKKLIYIVFLTILWSCNKTIEIELPEQTPKLVVNCLFVPFTFPEPQNFKVEVLQSSSILDTTKKTKVETATVKLFCEDSLVAIIPYVDSLGYYQSNYFPQQQKNYHIEVSAQGFETVYANNIIPNKVFIKDTIIIPNAYVDKNGFVYSQIKLIFDDPPNENNYYEVFFNEKGFNNEFQGTFIYSDDVIITSENYYPDLTTIGLQNPVYLPFSDKLINGQEHEFTISYFSGINVSGGLQTGDIYFLIFRTISEEYYNYRTSQLEFFYNKYTDVIYGQNEPINLYSNIENGFGIFAGFQEQQIIYIVDTIPVY